MPIEGEQKPINPVLLEKDGEPLSAWLSHRMRAVKSFVKNVTVVDDRPAIAALDFELVESPAIVSGDIDEGMGNLDEIPAEIKTPSLAEDGQRSLDDLNIRDVSDAFADEGIACAFVLPNSSASDVDAVAEKSRIIKASQFSDMVIIDWLLRGRNSNYTTDILTEIAKLDSSDNGRLRLICIYTGQQVDQVILDDAKDALKAGGIFFPETKPQDGRFDATSDRCHLVILNKANILAADLPKRLLNEFSRLADGILPTFAIAALGSIRSNAHHMITRFGAEMDSAYVANRLITTPPEDAEELVRSLFVAECQAAIEYDHVSEKFLGRQALLDWIQDREMPASPYIILKQLSIDPVFVERIIDSGLEDGKVTFADGSIKKFHEVDRIKLCEAFSKGPLPAQGARRQFARLNGLVREAFGKNRHKFPEEWRPVLTTGTILCSSKSKLQDEHRFYICLTPSCSTVRLKSPRKFVFIRNTTFSPSRSNLVITNAEGIEESLYFDREEPDLVTLIFPPDSEIKRAIGTFSTSDSSAASSFRFNSIGANAEEFTWIADMRNERINRDLTDLISNWVKIGINDFEMLRLAGKNEGLAF